MRTTILAAFLFGSATSAVAQNGELTARLDSAASAFVALTKVPSVAVAVVHGRDTLLLRGYGLADRDAKRAATPNTIYEIGSLTKQITASAIMRLAEQGKLRLDDTISKYVRFPLQGHVVTIRNLLNHTSGIHNYTNVRAWRDTWASDLSADSIVGFVARDTFDFAPGTKWSYSNTGYVLLGMIIEKVSGKPYEKYVQDEFFTPLHLTHMRYCESHPTDTLVAKGYRFQGEQLVSSSYLSMTHPRAAGSLCASVGDWIAFENLFYRSKVVSPASVVAMTTPSTPAGSAVAYGFGLGMGPVSGHKAIMHSGGINGFATHQVYFPDDSLYVAVFTNVEAPPSPLALDLARVVLGVKPNGWGTFDRPGKP